MLTCIMNYAKTSSSPLTDVSESRSKYFHRDSNKQLASKVPQRFSYNRFQYLPEPSKKNFTGIAQFIFFESLNFL